MKKSKSKVRHNVLEDPDLGFLTSLVNYARESIHPQKVILFGSRARGDHHKRSDVDLYFEVPDLEWKEWAWFTETADENSETLLDIDFVLAGHCSEDVEQSVEREGVVIYQAKT